MNIAELNRRSVAVNPLILIDRIIADLELTPNQYDDATTSYKAVAAVLQKVNPQLRANIFPQGSMRLGTTVRPIQGERFDLDMVCWLAVSGKQYSPDQVYEFVWTALGDDATYRQMRKRKSRCIRLEYAPERKFYLDVTPAIYDQESQRLCLYLPGCGFWDDSKSVASTIMLWAWLWLQYFELWLVTDEWHGRGEHPEAKEKLSKELAA